MKDDTRGDLDLLCNDAGKEAAEALARYAAVYSLKAGIPAAILDGPKLATILIHPGNGSFKDEYQSTLIKMLAETREKFHIGHVA